MKYGHFKQREFESYRIPEFDRCIGCKWYKIEGLPIYCGDSFENLKDTIVCKRKW
jgi:hypothetical protein